MATLSNTNAIPVMTAYTTPSGIASASSESNTTTLAAWKAFNGNISDNWQSTAVLPAWVAYEFPTQKVISSYAIATYSTTTNYPKAWTFEGSNDNTNWTVLDTQSNITNLSSIDRVFNFTNNTKYKAYRINITASNGGTSTTIAELKMFEMIYANKFLILNGNGEFISITTKDPNLNVIPAMTSATAPSGVVSSSSTTAANYDYLSFDKLTTGNGWLAGGISNQWLSYNFSSKKIISKYTIISNNVNSSPKDWTFEGSNDGASWTVLDTQTNQTGWTVGVKREYSFANNNPYTTYRIFIKTNNGHATYISIAEMEMMENYATCTSIGNDAPTEQSFLNYGAEISQNTDITMQSSSKNYISKNSVTLGSGKTFSKTIDLVKYKVNKIKFQ